ncbi:putative aldouronate transport system substrate-binding protein [Paenibacillus endophyticus]|uniref:Putative aldouronate transport system substrate-binding protein n=1 Tax=Paenibacillus endophyticus TaxID=1294268 RepID=A0A7W5C729_9BACL|nr:extracellular solute-binding protein [Paenibacillus endophyticus]MBB3151874.1 putative aldouronate transport system substrate-binding protein [Paenibacillus endophyticus]
MKGQRKLIAAMISIILCMSMVVACSNGTNTGNSPEVKETESTSPTSTNEESPTVEPQPNDRTKFDPPVTITAALQLKPSDKLRNGDTPEDNPISRWFKDNLGIVTKYKWVVTDSLETKVRLAMTSGEALPDVLSTSGTLFEDLVASGKIQSIDEAFEKYATERVKDSYIKNPEIWNSVKRDGKIYGLPTISNGIVGATVMWVRQDWLDKLGLKAPTNIAEFDAVMEAFTNQDPDRNNKNDTYGLALGGNTGYYHPTSNYMADTSFIFGQDQPYLWIKDESGSLQYGSTLSGVKDGLGKLKDWFTKGYLSPDFGTQDAAKAMADFTSGKAGIAFAPGWSGGWPIGTAVAEAEGKNQSLSIKPYPLPAGVNGEVGRQASLPSYGTYVFSKDFNQMEAIFKYWDTLYGCAIEDPKCPFDKGYGEGYDYVLKDGKPEWKDVPDGIVSLNAYLMLSPASGTSPTNVMEGPNIYQRVASGQLNNVFEQKLAASNGKLTIDGFAVAYEQLAQDVPSGFYGANTTTMKEKWDQLSTLEEQTFLQIIYGKQPLDYFDTFVKQWNDQGGMQITKEVNEAVTSMK